MKGMLTNFSPELRPQLRRFCLYGFLKNLQFFEPFIILVFLDKGLSFTEIGLLISFRSICVNLLEVPSGAFADTWGLRRSMIFSMLAYMLSFVVFAAAEQISALFIAMTLFSLGEAFRTGTHKAMIFNWVDRHGLTAEKTRIYGLTRSWSKQGSSLNCIAAAAILIAFKEYAWVFLISTVPYLLNILNLWMYPRYLDTIHQSRKSFGQSLVVLKSGLKLIFSRKQLLSLITENICFEGIFSVVKDYLQPVLKAMALAMPIMLAAADRTRTAVLVAIIYFVLNQGSSYASRLSHRAVEFAGSERKLGYSLWLAAALCYLAMLAGFHYRLPLLAVASFVAVYIMLNIWKPVFVSRFHDQADRASAATTLSVANQSKTLAVAVAAPAVGMIIDRSAASSGIQAFWPAAAIGLAAAITGLIISSRNQAS